MSNHTHRRQAFHPASLPGLTELWTATKGDPRVVIAVLDGVVDTAHPALGGAALTRVPTLVMDSPQADSPMCGHGTHVASVLFGRTAGGVSGIAPGCSGLLVPIFPNHHQGPVPQSDVARGIEQALDHGAKVINISGGQLVSPGGTDHMLERAVERCQRERVVLVAAAGNDGCECLHAPAAVASALAVGALGLDGRPLASSNWGAEYSRNGILAPGERIVGARVGGGAMTLTGTSFAAPLVSGIAALLISLQLELHGSMDPHAVRAALLTSAKSRLPAEGADRRRFLAGILNVRGAHELIVKGDQRAMSDEAFGTNSTTETSHLASGAIPSQLSGAIPSQFSEPHQAAHPATDHGEIGGLGVVPAVDDSRVSVVPAGKPAQVTAAGCHCHSGSHGLVFAIGTVGYDFGTEARRDTFRQQMSIEATWNPYNPADLVAYLQKYPTDSTKVIWTLNLELTPIYAVEAEMPYAEAVYLQLAKALDGQVKPDSADDYISRVSISGALTGRTVRLFSGQVVPVVRAQSRGFWAWNVNTLIKAALQGVRRTGPGKRAVSVNDEERIKEALSQMLNRIYYDLRNFGQSPAHRALNFSATNLFHAADAIAAQCIYPDSKTGEEKVTMYQLRDISVERSPFCRHDSDCWDVKLRFFDPDNVLRAATVSRFTVDVSDALPVTVGPVRTWSEVAG